MARGPDRRAHRRPPGAACRSLYPRRVRRPRRLPDSCAPSGRHTGRHRHPRVALVMLKDIVDVKPLGGHRLYLRFEDGVAGELDFARRLWFEGVFAPLRDPAVFAQVRVHPELGTLAWPNGADLDPDVLYAELSGTTIGVPPAPTRRPS